MRKAFVVGVVTALIAGLFYVVPAGAQEAPEPPPTSGGGLVTADAPGTWVEQEAAGGIGSFAENPVAEVPGLPVPPAEEDGEPTVSPQQLGDNEGAYKMRTGNGGMVPDGPLAEKPSSGRVFLSDTSFAGLRLEDLRPVSYSTLTDENSLAHDWNAVTFEIPVYGHVGAVEDNDFFTTLVFEPRLAQTEQSTAEWKTWDLVNDPYWRLTGSNECDGGCTWEEVADHVSTLPSTPQPPSPDDLPTPDLSSVGSDRSKKPDGIGRPDDVGGRSHSGESEDEDLSLLVVGNTGIRLAVGSSGAGTDWTDFVGYVDAVNVNATRGLEDVRSAGEETTNFEATVNREHAPTAKLHLEPDTEGPATAKFVADEGGAFMVTTAPSHTQVATVPVSDEGDGGEENGTQSAAGSDSPGEGYLDIPLVDGTPIAELQELSYSTFVSNPTDLGIHAIGIRLILDDGDDTRTLIYEPAYDDDYGPGNTVTEGEWQRWDALTGIWWELGPEGFDPLPWSSFVADYGDATITLMTLTAGEDNESSPWFDFSGLADQLVLATDGNVTNVDFRPAGFPKIAGVTIQKPAAGVFTDSVLKAVAGTVSDPDEEQADDLTVTFEWFRGGTSVQEGDTIDLNRPGMGSYGDTITVRATVEDPDGYTATAEDSVEVGNSLPTLSGATMSPTTPHSDSIVSARAGAPSDKDGHSVSYEYEWFRGTSATGTKIGTDHWIDLGKANTADANDTLTLRITPVDSAGGKGQPREASVKVAAAPVAPPSGGGTNPPPTTGGGTTPSPTPTATPTARPTPTPTPTPSATPTVTPTPTPTATPTPEKTERRSWTDLSIEKRSGTVNGRVLAADTACMAKRVVTITKVGRVSDRVIGRDRANRRGFWELKSRLKPGKYYASVQLIEIEIDEATTLRCDESETRAVRIKRYDRRWM